MFFSSELRQIEKPVLRQIEWRVQNEPTTKS